MGSVLSFVAFCSPHGARSVVEARFSAAVEAWLVSRSAAGPVDLGDVARLAAVDPAGLDAGGRVDLIQAFERLRSQVDGLQQRALAAVVAATEDVGLAGDAARLEVGAALRLAPATAARRTRVAADLVRRLPATLDKLAAGEIGYQQAAYLAEAVRELPDAVARVVQDRVLDRLPDKSVTETRRAVDRAVIAADPEGAQARHDRAVRERGIARHRLPEAMAGWWVTLPAHLEQAAWATLSTRAAATQRAIRDQAGDDPGLTALRVDALLDAIDAIAAQPPADQPTGQPPAGQPTGQPAGAAAGASDDAAAVNGGPGRAPIRPLTTAGQLPRCRCGGAQTAAVVIDLPTLIGLAEHAGELPGYGPIPAGLARELAADRDWVRWTIDPGTRHLLDRGAERYRPSQRLRAFIAAAHQRCGFPGCDRAAELCDCDHTVTFRRRGRTVVLNLGPLCRQHHNAKTHGRWRIVYDDDTGCKTWTSPFGRTYTKALDPILE